MYWQIFWNNYCSSRCNFCILGCGVEKMRERENGSPRCQQMLMGEGKTTVIAPLLVLLLADTNR